MRPGDAAVSVSQMWHRRNRPAHHEFRQRVVQIWIDPDRPEELFDHHPLWSCGRWRPVRFARHDYLDGSDRPIGPAVRDLLEEPLGRRPAGPVRMLTQPRTWGWLFNPITVYLAWDGGGPPVGAVLEVTNTPWKERLTYPLALEADGGRLRATFAKRLHVSPFLDEDHHYHLALTPGDDGRNFELTLDVVPSMGTQIGGEATDDPVMETSLLVERRPPTTAALTAALARHPLATHRVSLGIHVQAARLVAKRVPFVPHPKRRP